MSSSVTGSTLRKGKILFHIAENGRSFDLDCDETMLVEEIMGRIESLSGYSFDDQLLLYLDTDLKPNRRLSEYKLPCDKGEVFIFNRTKVQANSLPPQREEVNIPHLGRIPSRSSSLNPRPLDDALNPALKALTAYERLFIYHHNRGREIFRHSMLKYEYCERLLRELMVQERAIEVARGNLDQHYKFMNQNYGNLMKHYKQQHRKHSHILMNFETNVEKLKSTKLHPALQTPTYKCLMDFANEDKLRESMEICTKSHEQLENEVSHFEQTFSEMKHKVEKFLSVKYSSYVKDSTSIKDLEQKIKEHRKHIDEQENIIQSLSKDVNYVKTLVDDGLSCQSSSSLHPQDAVSALDPVKNVHDKDYLPKMQTLDHAILKLLEFCKERKDAMNWFVHKFLQNITRGSYLIEDQQELQFLVIKKAMTRTDDFFEDLKLFHGIGPAYRACFAEVVRRKASKNLYMGMAGQMGERLGQKREVEMQKRMDFLSVHGSCIPDSVLNSMGLFDLPGKCAVDVDQFDEDLLNIDIADVYRYAPEYLDKVSSALSKGKDVASGSCARHYSEPEDTLDGSELVEVCGTSRMAIENVKLGAEHASKILLHCSPFLGVEHESLDNDRVDGIMKTSAEKIAGQYVSYETRIRELEEEMNQVKAICNKHQQEKQEKKEKISLGPLEVDEIAAFVPNASGHYQAITKDYSNYYLSPECVTVFAGHLPSRPKCIVGRVVDIEHRVVKTLLLTYTQPEHARADQSISDAGTDRLSWNSGSASNPYGLPTGCDYFLVKVVMLPGWTGLDFESRD